MIRTTTVVFREGRFSWSGYYYNGCDLIAHVAAPPVDHPERIYGSLPTDSDVLVVTCGKAPVSAEAKRLKTFCSLSRITPVSRVLQPDRGGGRYATCEFDRRDSFVEGSYLVREVLFKFSPGSHKGMMRDLVERMRAYAAGEAIDWGSVDELDDRNLLYPDDDPPEWTILYALLDPDGSIRYIGKTFVSLEARLKQHMREAEEQKNPRDVWIAGLSCPPKIVMLKTVPTSEWQHEECHLVRAYYHVLGARLTNTAYLYEKCPHGCDWARHGNAVVRQWGFVKLQGGQLICPKSHASGLGWTVVNMPEVACDVLEAVAFDDYDILLLTRENTVDDSGRVYAISRLLPVFAPARFESLWCDVNDNSPWRYDSASRKRRRRGERLDGGYMVRGVLLDAKGTRTLGDEPLIHEMSSLMRSYAAGGEVDWGEIGKRYDAGLPQLDHPEDQPFGFGFDEHDLRGL